LNLKTLENKKANGFKSMTKTIAHSSSQVADAKNTSFAYQQVGLQGDATHVIFIQPAREVTHGG